MKLKIAISSILLFTILVCLKIYSVSAIEDKPVSNLVNLKTELSEDKKEVSVIVSINEYDHGIMGMQGKLEYNKDKLSYKSNEVLVDNFNITAFNEETGSFLIEIDDESFFDKTKYLNSNTDLIKFTFNINKGVNKDTILLNGIKLVYGDNLSYNTIDCEGISVKIVVNNIISIVVIIGVILILGVVVVGLRKRNNINM